MRVFASLAAASFLAIAAIAPGSAQAAGPGLGASFSEVVAVYGKSAVELKGGAAKTLRLTDITYEGLKWGTVDFVFDVSNHLSAVRLTTRTESFDAVQKLVVAKMQSSDFGVQTASDAKQDDFQVKLCESAAGVTMTIERETVSA